MTRYHKLLLGELEAGTFLKRTCWDPLTMHGIGAGAVCCRDPVESLVMGTSALACLLIIEARRTNESLAAVTSLVGEGAVALVLQTQYDAKVAAPDHLLSVRRLPETVSRCLHVATACNRCTPSHHNSPKMKYKWCDGVHVQQFAANTRHVNRTARRTGVSLLAFISPQCTRSDFSMNNRAHRQ
jgi:hypothetical protein